MNERIIELANEANKDIGYTFKMEEAKQLHELMAKFAELIIQECVQACINEGKTYEVESAGEYASNLYVTAIKEHFGVEE